MFEAYGFDTKAQHEPWIVCLRVNNTKLSFEFAGMYKQPLLFNDCTPKKKKHI